MNHIKKELNNLLSSTNEERINFILQDLWIGTLDSPWNPSEAQPILN